MTRIGAEFFIEVHGITADENILGQTVTVMRGDQYFRIEFPTAPDAFKFMHSGTLQVGDAGTPDPREYPPTTAVLVQPGNRLVEVRLLRIVANTDSALSVTGLDWSEPGVEQLHDDVLFDLRGKAVELVGELCEWLKLEINQHWIEPAGTFPRVVNGAGLVDLDAGLTFGRRIGQGGSFRVVAPDTVLDAESLPKVEAKLKSGHPHPDELLLAESKHLVDLGREAEWNRATLLAAIAVELRIKRLLRTLAGPRRTEAVERLYRSSDEGSVHNLFLKSIRTLLGGQLEGQHKALAARVQRLFEARNGIAHHGEIVAARDAAKHVETAWQAAALIDQISSTGATGATASTG